MRRYHYTVLENDAVFQSWQKAWPTAVIVQMQFINSSMHNVSSGEHTFKWELGIVFTLPEDTQYP